MCCIVIYRSHKVHPCRFFFFVTRRRYVDMSDPLALLRGNISRPVKEKGNKRQKKKNKRVRFKRAYDCFLAARRRRTPPPKTAWLRPHWIGYTIIMLVCAFYSNVIRGVYFIRSSFSFYYALFYIARRPFRPKRRGPSRRKGEPDAGSCEFKTRASIASFKYYYVLDLRRDKGNESALNRSLPSNVCSNVKIKTLYTLRCSNDTPKQIETNINNILIDNKDIN